MELFSLLAGFVLLLVGVAMYMLPAIVAHKREHHNASAITVLTILAGWTVLGWVVAMVWAFTSRPVTRP